MDLVQPILIIILATGSTYLSFATSTEAAGVGVMAALALTAFYRTFIWPVLRDAMLSSVTTTGMTLPILISAFYLNFILGVLGVPGQVSTFVTSFDVQPLTMILLLVVLYMVPGCFLDALVMMIVAIPIDCPADHHFNGVSQCLVRLSSCADVCACPEHAAGGHEPLCDPIRTRAR